MNAPNNVKTQTQTCLQQFYSSPIGNAVQFGSPLSAIPGWNQNWQENLKSWGEVFIGKGGGFLGSGLGWGRGQVSTINGTVDISSTAEVWADAGLGLLEKLGTAGLGAATGEDILAHAGCATGARQSAGQMTPLPPGWESSL